MFLLLYFNYVYKFIFHCDKDWDGGVLIKKSGFNNVLQLYGKMKFVAVA